MKQNSPELQTEAQERRTTHRLLRYWESLCAGRSLPEENDIDPDDITDIWDYCFLIQVLDIERREGGNYTYLGKAIIEAYRDGLNGDACGELVSPNPQRLGHNFAQVILTARPQTQEGEFVNTNKGVVKFRQCMVPMGDGAGKVIAVFGCMAFMLS